MTIKKGWSFMNLMKDGSGNTRTRPIYIGEITPEVANLIDFANAKTPLREGSRIDPYMQAIQDIEDRGVEVKWEHYSNTGKAR